MAFGVSKQELTTWKEEANSGRIAFLTHYWHDERFPSYPTVTKVACNNIDTLVYWGEQYGLNPSWIHHREDFPHFDLLGDIERAVLVSEGKEEKLNQLLEKLDERC